MRRHLKLIRNSRKIFEYSRLGLPTIYFDGGEGETIVEKHKLGWVSEVGNYEVLNQIISKLKITGFSADLKNKIQKTALECFDATEQQKILNYLI